MEIVSPQRSCGFAIFAGTISERCCVFLHPGCKLSEFERVTALKVYNWFANRRKEMKRRANIGEDLRTCVLSLSMYSLNVNFLRAWRRSLVFSFVTLVGFQTVYLKVGDFCSPLHPIMRKIACGQRRHVESHFPWAMFVSEKCPCACLFPAFPSLTSASLSNTTRSCHFGKPWNRGAKSKLPLKRRGWRDAGVCRSGESSILRAGRSTWCHLRGA